MPFAQGPNEILSHREIIKLGSRTCRAPIASLDCMEEFSAGSALSALAERPGEGGITKEQLLLSGLSHSAPAAPLQLARQTSITPGLRYRNLGKSGLRVSNIGLGTWPTFSPNVTEEQAEQIIVLQSTVE
ncbi:hypothetical protein NQ317_003267 [Molorchus minor]|uniref:Uncharacterized protein n=1 Tax=Molorchus minor TaxID=1323400 RepID=A0ABQ9JLA7_9CUCU|nr:hypothetical protein NQ317_003267 [Molorchus minor]